MERDLIYRRSNTATAEEPITQKPKDFVNTLEFLERAYSEDAHKKKPAKFSERQWLRIINMVDIYCYQTDATTEDVGLMYDITTERARQLIKKGILRLRQNTLPQTQEFFPIEILCFRKPHSQKSSERRSLGQGGISLLIRDGLRAGKSIQQIKEENKIPLSKIFRSRPRLRAWGVEIPYAYNSFSKHKA